MLVFACVKKEEAIHVFSKDPLLQKEKGVYKYDGNLLNGTITVQSIGKDTLEYAEYQNGLKNGISKKFWPNGNLRLKGNYQEGIYQGLVSEWYENGKPYSAFNYRKGKEYGKQQVWNLDGSFKANYEVKGDRKYGLTGVKNCSNVWED